MSEDTPIKPSNFIRQILGQDLDGQKHSQIVTRFPPEPNGYLHVGHAKSICLNFGLANDYQGQCNLRFDDTNPAKEEDEYIRAIQSDVEWLGFEWAGDTRYASGYFGQIHQFAVELIEKGFAYVCALDAEDARAYRGTLTEGGRNSPYRERPVKESLDLFERMKAGEFAEGEYVLRAKIDMASPNMNLRDPILYRIRHIEHHQTGDQWCIYPMYDFTHPISDALEGVTHSLCTLEFEDHRPLYDWVLDNISIDCHPRQIEFARLNINYTLTSKRKLKQLVDEAVVTDWDDPRMPTISGMRRRGYTSQAIRNFCDSIGVSKANSTVDMSMLEAALRDDLNQHAPRAMGVLKPLKLVITNWEDGHVESLQAPNHPQNPELGTRQIMMGREVYIDAEDFKESANKKFKRLVLEKEVRLRYGYVIKANEVVKDSEGNILEVHCTYDKDTLGNDPEGRKVKGVIHWVSAAHSIEAEVRLYDRLFNDENPDGHKDQDFMEFINLDSLTVLQGCRLEQGLAVAQPQAVYQFEREGYFCLDKPTGTGEAAVFNKTIGLRDSWAKVEQQ